jgi:hypothetical protein
LSILDRMERRAEDPTELEDLFRVDHLATRMRRHAEDLVILAGASPGRGWRNPIPLVDVLRGAVSEVEDYARVSIRPMPDVAIAGRAVGDIIHLLAELIENATSFSPPNTRVHVGGELVPHGLVLEIEDRGLGMTAEALAEFNARLADPPEFDPAASGQLGLFVVARLSTRHGVQVRLRPSPYGGVSAVTLIPEALVGAPVDTGGAPALPAGPRGTNGGRPLELPTAEHEVVVEDDEITIAIHPRLTAEVLTSPQEPDAPLPRRRSGGADDAITPTSGPVAPRHARSDVIEAVEEDADGLPRRVRQTSMAPQLRDNPPKVDNPTPTGSGRTPEQLRAMMTSFQTGMTRGRWRPTMTATTHRRRRRDAGT